jgi:hypothetical protein
VKFAQVPGRYRPTLPVYTVGVHLQISGALGYIPTQVCLHCTIIVEAGFRPLTFTVHLDSVHMYGKPLLGDNLARYRYNNLYFMPFMVLVYHAKLVTNTR